MIVEVPLWSLIVFGSVFLIMFLHILFGDLLGKVLYNHIKDKENKGDKK